MTSVLDDGPTYQWHNNWELIMKYATALLMVFLAAPALADEAAQKVMDCMQANLPPTARVQQLELASTDRAGGTRVLEANLYAMLDKGLLRLSLRIIGPPDLAGSAYLLRETEGDREDDIYLSLPKAQRIRHITGAQASQSLFGTDFSYADVRQIQGAFAAGDSKLEAPAEIDKRPVHVLVQKPQEKKVSPYTMVRSWVDQQTCVPLKTEFYEGDKPRKRLTSPAASLKQSGKHWYPGEMEMVDLKTETRTTLKLGRIMDVDGLSIRYFNPSTFNYGN
jgi:hypothetical protein